MITIFCQPGVYFKNELKKFLFKEGMGESRNWEDNEKVIEEVVEEEVSKKFFQNVVTWTKILKVCFCRWGWVSSIESYSFCF